MAVFSLSSSQLRLVQGFTADASLLAKAVSYKGDIKKSTPEDAKSSDAALLAVQHTLELAASGHAGQAALANAAQMGAFRADSESSSTDDQEQMTLAALGQIARYLSAIPGRKNLIWFSGSFPLFIDLGHHGPLTATRDYAKDVRETDILLAAARIAVYPVDAHGLVRPESSVDDASALGVIPSGAAYKKAVDKADLAHPDHPARSPPTRAARHL